MLKRNSTVLAASSAQVFTKLLLVLKIFTRH